MRLEDKLPQLSQALIKSPSHEIIAIQDDAIEKEEAEGSVVAVNVQNELAVQNGVEMELLGEWVAGYREPQVVHEIVVVLTVNLEVEVEQRLALAKCRER